MHCEAASRRRLPALALVLFGTFFHALPSRGGPPVPQFGTSASAGTQVPCPVQEDFSTGPFQSGAEAGCNAVDGDVFADVRGTAETRLGILRSEAILNTLGYPFSDAGAMSGFFDNLTVNAASVPAGTVGRLLVRMPFSGALVTDIGGAGGAPFLLPMANVYFEVEVLSSRGTFRVERSAFRMLETQEGEASGVVVLPIEFVFGEPFRVSAFLSTGVLTQTAAATQFAFASSRYGSTAWWLGVEKVRLQNGLPMATFEIASESGTDYGADTVDNALELLYDGGGFVTHPGQGAGGADASMLGSDWPLNGFNVQFNPGGQGERRVADRFLLSEARSVGRVVTYAFEAGLLTPGWTGFNMNIWSGRPEDAGSQLLASTAMASFDTTGVFRVPAGEESLGSTFRPVFAIEWFFEPLLLSAGEYWIDWQVEGGSGAFAVPAMAVNPEDPNDPITVAGVARQLAPPPTGWQDFGGIRALATPFQVLGPPDQSRIFRDGFE